MENASKALIMAGEILIGIMIVSIAVYLFNMMGEYSRNTNKAIEDTQIAQFNSQFLKYEGSTECTIHDIVSLANLANKHNKEYEIDSETGEKSDNTLYVQIDIKNVKTNIERSSTDLVGLIKNYSLKTDPSTGTYTSETKYYKCIKCDINPNTRRVNYIVFTEM